MFTYNIGAGLVYHSPILQAHSAWLTDPVIVWADVTFDGAPEWPADVDPLCFATLVGADP